MSDLRNVMKGGWHPKGKDGGKESWRGDFKGINQVAGWMGKGKKPGEGDSSEHISRPLATLKDPSSFGPPPRNVNYHGGAALPNQITPHTGGLGAPLSREEIEAANRIANGPTQEEIEEQQKPAGPPLPYRADRTGLKTNHLPPPPVHRDRAPIPEPVTEASRPKPAPPPRLPARQNTGSSVVSAISPPPYEPEPRPAPPPSRTSTTLNQAAIGRLGKAGVSVPAFGIGKPSNPATNAESNPWQDEPSQWTTSPNPQSPQPPQHNMSELQSRFARMTSNSAAPAPSSTLGTNPTTTTTAQSPTSSQPQSQGTTWAQKQAALRTGSNLYQNPQAVTMQDARSAAGTANNFRERHGDTIQAAGTKASAWNKRYNVTGQINSFLEKHSSPTSETPPNNHNNIPNNNTNNGAGTAAAVPASAQHNPMMPPLSPNPATISSSSADLTASISRKPPAPPPPKKPMGMHGNSTAAPAPPVPLGTKPNFS